MLQTLAQKLLARASGLASVKPGEIVTCKVDLAMMHDSGGPRRIAPMLKELGAKPWDADKIVVITDHYLPAYDDESRNIIRIARDWVATEGVKNFHDNMGICHVVLPEQGHLKPGMFVVGGDSHSCTGGAFGAYMLGIGSTEMFGVVATGEIWIRVPETILIEWQGKFGAAVSAKDAMLFLCAKLGLDGGNYQAVEYAGSAIAALPMQERMTLSNMTAEIGGQVGLIAPDETTRAFLHAAGAKDIDITWHGDAEASVAAHHRFNANDLSPQVAAPGSPTHSRPVGEFTGEHIDIAYIGACTGAKLEDLRMAARVFKGRRAAKGVRLMVAPASQKDQKQAADEGTLDILVAAGAKILPNTCGVCAGYGEYRFAENETIISSTARNFTGRMGADSARVFLGSPFTVAASAIAGHICNPMDIIG
ncbi:MAG: 3-isopropylmalate dehydratase large subunit [Burkholderiales bacterium]